MDYERFADIAAELAQEIPAPLYHRLNLGVGCVDGYKLHPESVRDDLYVLGEYRSGPMTGCGILLYYQSFCRMYGTDEARLRPHIRRVLRHEFRHHWEYLSCESALEQEDARRIGAYLDDRDQYPQ